MFQCRYGQGSGQIHITELECSRNDIHILHCNIRNRLQCDHSSDVAVICCKLTLLNISSIFMCNVIIVVTSYTTKKLKNKAFLNSK